MRKYLYVVLACAIILTSPGLCIAQEESIEEAPLLEEPMEELDYSNGIITSIDTTSNKITISEYDWGSDAEVTVTYLVDPNVKVENMGSWQELAVGSDIDIEFVKDASGNMIIKGISVYTPESPEE